ncbi:hypothetical protein OKW24_002855 [Peribacillus simplex]|uniref:hypothetical protein n=1 Tax=Peribacillus simplex TaxID=1478 RepID=UPI0024E1B99B|nr:hypothetical protein [Peribacillus simplex]MDF9761082.1 hypothetical protein [Peribacillus simplex]
MDEICIDIPKDAEVHFERCRVVNICAYVNWGVKIDLVKETICRQIEIANKIWCPCNIVFNLIKVEELRKFVDNPGDYDFEINEIYSPEDFFNNMTNYPTAKKLYDLSPCCSDKPHVNLYYVRGDQFQNGEFIAAKGDSQNHKYFIMMPAYVPEQYLAHGLGHCFGLNDNLYNPDSVMYPSPPGIKTFEEECKFVGFSELVQTEFYPVSYTTPYPKYYGLVIENMEVSEVDDGWDTDDDLEIEWDFLFEINDPGSTGTSQHIYWNYDGVDEDRTYLLNLTNTFQIKNEHVEIYLHVSGTEFDEQSSDDELPKGHHSYDKTNSWGKGSHTFELSNDEITCKINYRIEELLFLKQEILKCRGAII